MLLNDTKSSSGSAFPECQIDMPFFPVGFLPIGDKDSTTYFFNSCNTNNKEDFLNVMRSIKFRGDLNMGN